MSSFQLMRRALAWGGVAGYVLADCGGEAAPGRLRTAVAYGSAAASMAGSALPRPEHLNTADVVITDLG